MNYIVLDLEWNQSAKGKEFENPRIPFEIIEIGAIKLNNEKQQIEEFHRIVKPVLYKTMHFHTQNIIQISKEELEQGTSFSKAAQEFFQWCGDEYKICTWGNTDLIELQRNLKFYGCLSKMKPMVQYYDIQKIFALYFGDGKTRKALKTAVELLNIPISRPFHRALDDAFYTALIMQKIDTEFVKKYYSIDTYQNPKNRKQEVTAVFDDYSKYISKEFETKEAAMKDRVVIQTYCMFCGKRMKRTLRWFGANQKSYYCIASCGEHGYFRGHIRMKKTDEEKYYVIKTLKMASEEEVVQLKERRKRIREKRYNK